MKSLVFPSFVLLTVFVCYASPPARAESDAATQASASPGKTVSPDKAGAEIRFNESIRPILSRHCISCHGPDEEDQQAGLRLDTFAGSTEDMGGYAAIVPGDPDESEMMIRILTDDEDLRMPPADHADPLQTDEIQLLKQWIEAGAPYEDHWSFSPPKVVPVPENHDAPECRVENTIDSFILRRVLDAGLKPNQPADPRVLMRRVCLDLTGLPPIGQTESTRQLIDAYLKTPSQAAFGRVVDALLASDAYAEHWASMWLDLARYADTVGYAGDEDRDIWPWRDWLIRAIGSDKSYKQLSLEMLAGDMLPGADDQTRLATAFHRNTLSNNEGGTDDEEFRTIAVKDRLSTTVNAWMGLTVRCAECHSHKYDPISQTEYYQLLDFFNQSADSDHKDDRPKLELFLPPDPAVKANYDKRIANLKSQLAGKNPVWTTRFATKTQSREGTEFELLDDGSVLATGPNPKRERYAIEYTLDAGETINGFRLEAIPHDRHGGNVGRSEEGAFILTQVRLVQHDGDQETPIRLSKAEDDYHQVNQPASSTIRKNIKPGARKQGWAVNHRQTGYRGHHEAVFELAQPLVTTQETKVTLYLFFESPETPLNLGCFRVSTTDVAGAASKYKEKQLDPINRKIQRLITRRDQPVRVPIMQQLPTKQARQTFIMLRGNFRSPGEAVHAGFPEAFQADPKIPRNRLGMAQWLFDPANPLTARVAVNRYWSRLMGMGLVETEEDFGTQGTPPSHPGLLDHLAIHFRDGGWDVRGLIKMIVMSATYQQSSTADSQSLETDPFNRLLARGPRVRLSAEVVRDQALAVAGLLSNKMFGPPVYPPNPIKKVTNAFKGVTIWQESTGEDRYRRAIYTFVKRSSPHPLLGTFDVATRDICSMRRLRTNTPLQSFMMLNDVTFIEAARALAKRMLDAGDQLEDESEKRRVQIDTGIQRALFRPARSEEIDVLLQLQQTTRTEFENDPLAAAQFLGRQDLPEDVAGWSDETREEVIRHAVMTTVANVILNLDSFLNK